MIKRKKWITPNMMQIRATLFMALLCPCFLALAEPIHLQLRWHHQFQFAGYYAALEKGYYKAAGLDVIIHEGSPAKKPLQEVLQGHAQYGEANSELLLERLRGAPLVALAAVYQHSPSVLIARKDAGIFSPDGLVGKKIMLLDKTVDADFVAMFNNEGIDISRLHVIPSSYEIRDLVDGKVDAFNSYLSNEPYFLKQQGVEFTVLNPRNYGVDFYSDILFTTEEELKQHPERVKAFRQASLEGWYYAMDHPQEIIDLLLNKYKVNKSRDHLEFEADAIRSLIIPDVIDLGHMNPWRWRHMAETFVKAGMVENDKLLQDFSYDPNPKADQDKLRQYIKIAAVITLLTSVIALILLAAYRSLKRKNKIAARNEKLLRLAHEAAGIGYYVTDLATGQWESSPLLDQIFGIDAHYERNIQNWKKLIDPEYRQHVLDHYREIINNRERFTMEYAVIRPSDGKIRWVIDYGDIEYDKTGNPVQLVGTIQDITERKQAEAALRESEDAFRHLFEDSSDPILLLKQGVFIDCNVAALTQLGYHSKSELINCRPAEISPDHQPDGRNSVEKEAEMIATALRVGYHRFEWLHVRANGSLLPVEVSLTPMTVHGELIIHVCWRDITERKVVENKLRSRTDELALQNQILQQINQGADLTNVLNELTHQIEVLHPNMLCSILLLDEDNKHLRHGAAPSLPDFYNQAIDGLAIGNGVGSCGTAAYLGESVIIEDVQAHPYWEPFRDLARQANLQACWSRPIKNNQGRVLGTFAIYHRQPAQPTDAEISLIDHYTNLAQLAIERNQSMIQIAESLSILKATLESADEAILSVDMNNNWLLHNQKFLDLWQIPNETAANEIGTEKLPYESSYIKNQLKDAEAFSSKVKELYATPEAQSFDVIEFKDGRIVERNSIPQMINNKVVGRVWSFRNVTEQKLAEAELRIAATAFESQEAMSISDANQVILKVNKAFIRITGYSPEDVIGQTHAVLKSGRQNVYFYQALQHSLKQNGYWEGEIWNRRKNGDVYPAWLSITTVTDSNNRITNYVASFADITKDKEAEETIHNLAYYDPLTSLPNRRLLWERLKHGIELERRDSKHLALLMLDLDRFKIVNDSMGHLAGDELLQQVAARIKTKLREVDMVARLGGDEFVVLLEDIAHPEDAARVAEAIVSDLSKPFQLLQSNNAHPELSRKVRIGASIGISLFPQHGDSPETLMDNADIALYRAKDEGRGCFAYFSEEFTLIARERIAMEARLRRATEQQELCVYYQAQIDIDSDRIIGAEALVRWKDPSEGLISPSSFIPIAEETGLIVEIGAWVLRETCLQGRRWIDAGLPPLTLAVNVSPHQFRRSDISALVAEVLHETGFPAELLELELTESGLMENEEKTVEVLNNLRAQGVRLAIDDFGTGYSSLANLKRFPLDVLKIDKSFIDDIPSLQDDMEITATIVAMGHILGFKVLAEGVETLEQLAFLREKGCDTYQGFIKSKPLPAEEFVRLLREQV
ncbi:EAL domain-containing protein [Methylobacter sp.]|uniref:EAL domain-containing protein n=1 Tax=Methylobacter sp. TaxID=2051955 RepID=UPI0025F3EAF8|nr:EAL domain-containing protein [Methylobacter sp.]